jgi:hypothetical protein
VRGNEPLTVRQVEVLQWISDGCPDGVWSDFTYKTTAYALAARGLVKVDRRRDQWSASITGAGEFYLAHGQYPSDATLATEKHTPSETGSGTEDLAAHILKRLTSGEGSSRSHLRTSGSGHFIDVRFTA